MYAVQSVHSGKWKQIVDHNVALSQWWNNWKMFRHSYKCKRFIYSFFSTQISSRFSRRALSEPFAIYWSTFLNYPNAMAPIACAFFSFSFFSLLLCRYCNRLRSPCSFQWLYWSDSCSPRSMQYPSDPMMRCQSKTWQVRLPMEFPTITDTIRMISHRKTPIMWHIRLVQTDLCRVEVVRPRYIYKNLIRLFVK